MADPAGSTFAGNPYFIDLDKLCEQGYLEKSDYENAFWGALECEVNYAILYTERKKLFLKLQKNFESNIPADYYEFCAENAFWLDDYARFMAIKDEHRGASFDLWESSIRRRMPDSLKAWELTCLFMFRQTAQMSGHSLSSFVWTKT